MGGNMLTTIPFSGFYYTLHDSALDDAVDSMFQHDDGCTNHALAGRVHWDCKWGDVMRDYAEEYAGRFADEFGIKLTFDSMESPKEYNFTTDRIFCHIALDEAIRLLEETPEDVLCQLAKDTFTSRDGFISFYSPVAEEWGDISEWDHNQLGVLIQAHVNSKTDCGDGFDQWAEYRLMEDAMCNGLLNNAISEHTPTIDRLYKVWDYLNQREQRGE
jgi:hypothetical protein